MVCDLLTMTEHSEKPLNEMKLAYLGDSRCNMGNSLMIGAALAGVDFRCVAPISLHPSLEL